MKNGVYNLFLNYADNICKQTLIHTDSYAYKQRPTAKKLDFWIQRISNWVNPSKYQIKKIGVKTIHSLLYLTYVSESIKYIYYLWETFIIICSATYLFEKKIINRMKHYLFITYIRWKTSFGSTVICVLQGVS